MRVLLIFCLMAIMAKKAENKMQQTFFKSNQIIFQEQGKIINKAVYVYVAFKVDMGPALNLIDNIVAMLKDVNEMEAKNEGINILPYLMGTKESDLVWRNNETSELWIKRSKDGVAITLKAVQRAGRQIKWCLNDNSLSACS